MAAQYEFKDALFMTAEEKLRVIRAWERFVGGGFKNSSFTDALYHHLTLHCSFIAHYDKAGFYSTYFVDPDATVSFLHQFDSDFGYRSVEYNYATWLMQGEYEDINRAMCAVLEPVKAELYSLLQGKSRTRDIGEARRLLEKVGMGQLAQRVK